MIDGIAFGAILAEMNERGAAICISQRTNRQTPLQIDPNLCKRRHRIENVFGKLREFRRIARRADKAGISFKAMIHATAALINSR